MPAMIERIAMLGLLLAWPAIGHTAEPFYLGRWTIISVECNPSTGCNDLETEPMRKLVGSMISIASRSIEGPSEVACPDRYESEGATAYSLFIFGLQNIALPPGGDLDAADPSGRYYDPQKLAERLGFRGFSWKALRCDGRYVYFADERHAAMAIDRTVLRLERR